MPEEARRDALDAISILDKPMVSSHRYYRSRTTALRRGFKASECLKVARETTLVDGIPLGIRSSPKSKLD